MMKQKTGREANRLDHQKKRSWDLNPVLVMFPPWILEHIMISANKSHHWESVVRLTDRLFEPHFMVKAKRNKTVSPSYFMWLELRRSWSEKAKASLAARIPLQTMVLLLTWPRIVERDVNATYLHGPTCSWYFGVNVCASDHSTPTYLSPSLHHCRWTYLQPRCIDWVSQCWPWSSMLASFRYPFPFLPLFWSVVR